MTNLISFPGYLVCADRKTLLKAGKRYPGIKALIEDMDHKDRRRTYIWSCKRFYSPTGYRERVLAESIGVPFGQELHGGGNAA